MKPCLEHSEQTELYKEYFDFGQKKFDELESSSINSQSSPSGKQEPAASEDYANKEEIFNLSKFVLGMYEYVVQLILFYQAIKFSNYKNLEKKIYILIFK